MKGLLKITILLSAIFTIIITNVITTKAQSPVSKYVTNENTDSKTHAYLEKANAIRTQINAYTTQIKELKDYNSKINAKLKELNKKLKENKDIISSDKMKQIKELRKSLKTVEKKEKIVTEDDSIKSLVKNKEYDKALNKLNETLEAKKEQLKVIKERNAIWHQIDALIG